MCTTKVARGTNEGKAITILPIDPPTPYTSKERGKMYTYCSVGTIPSTLVMFVGSSCADGRGVAATAGVGAGVEGVAAPFDAREMFGLGGTTKLLLLLFWVAEAGVANFDEPGRARAMGWVDWGCDCRDCCCCCC